MANAKYDFAPGKFVLLEIGQDGPDRLEGHRTYDSFAAARLSAERYLRHERPRAKVTIFEVKYTYHLDPHPALISNAAEAAE